MTASKRSSPPCRKSIALQKRIAAASISVIIDRRRAKMVLGMAEPCVTWPKGGDQWRSTPGNPDRGTEVVLGGAGSGWRASSCGWRCWQRWPVSLPPMARQSRPARPAPPARPAVAAAASMAAPVGNAIPIVAESTLTELAPAVAYNGDRDEYLVVWYNDRPGNDDIRAQRVDGSGVLLGGPFYIAAGSGVERRNPSVAYSSGQQRYLVVYEHDDGTYSRIYGQRDRRRRPGAGCRVPAQQRRRAQELLHAGHCLRLDGGHLSRGLAAHGRGFDRQRYRGAACQRRRLAVGRQLLCTAGLEPIQPQTRRRWPTTGHATSSWWSGSATTAARHSPTSTGAW